MMKSGRRGGKLSVMRKPTKALAAALVLTSFATLSAQETTRVIIDQATGAKAIAAQTGGKSPVRKLITPRNVVILGGIAVLIGAIVGVSRSGNGRNLTSKPTS
jgi:hypothetical protein